MSAYAAARTPETPENERQAIYTQVRNELVLVKLVDSGALKNLTLVVTLVVSGIWDFW